MATHPAWRTPLVSLSSFPRIEQVPSTQQLACSGSPLPGTCRAPAACASTTLETCTSATTGCRWGVCEGGRVGRAWSRPYYVAAAAAGAAPHSHHLVCSSKLQVLRFAGLHRGDAAGSCLGVFIDTSLPQHGLTPDPQAGFGCVCGVGVGGWLSCCATACNLALLPGLSRCLRPACRANVDCLPPSLPPPRPSAPAPPASAATAAPFTSPPTPRTKGRPPTAACPCGAPRASCWWYTGWQRGSAATPTRSRCSPPPAPCLPACGRPSEAACRQQHPGLHSAVCKPYALWHTHIINRRNRHRGEVAHG